MIGDKCSHLLEPNNMRMASGLQKYNNARDRIVNSYFDLTNYVLMVDVGTMSGDTLQKTMCGGLQETKHQVG